jgi:exodeoxyribonuclease-3
MKIAAWNVNSIKVRLPHVEQWLAGHQPDVLCLQELKCETSAFPYEAIAATGYQAAVSGQKAYNGVALLSKKPLLDVVVGIPGFADEQQRVIAGTLEDTRVISVYCPNGEEVTSPKYRYKLEWYAALENYLREALVRYPRLVVAGDFNIAPEDRDVYDPKAWKDQVLCSEPERAAFQRLIGLGFADSFRLFEQPEKTWSWWHYRVNAFKRNMGLRIDHLLVSKALSSHCRESSIDKEPRGWERPSDHAPVWVVTD